MEPTRFSIEGLRKCGYIADKKTLLKVRLVRVELQNTIEVLMTNLWEEQGHGPEIFKDLYFMRWGVETNISVQKNIMQLESFSGLTAHTVLQDFYATVFTANLHSILIKHSQHTVDSTMKDRKYPMKINKNKSFGKLKMNIISLFMDNDVGQILLKCMINSLRRLFLSEKEDLSQELERTGKVTASLKHFQISNLHTNS